MNKKWLIVGILILISSIWWIVYVSQNSEKSKNISNNKLHSSSKKKIYEHTFPKRVSSSDFFKWEFISNEVVSIYPRRDALVKDILVDIWDTVKRWQTLAILFAPWVEWEAQSKINQKSTLRNTKQNLLKNIVSVKNAKISEIVTKIKEKETIIFETDKNFDAKINQIKVLEKNKFSTQISNIDNAKGKVEVEKNNLELIEKNLETAKSLKEEIISESKNNISQKKELLENKLDEILYEIVPIFFIWEESDIDYSKIKKGNVSYLFWAKDSVQVNILLNEFSKFRNTKKDMSILDEYNSLQNILSLLTIAVKNTIVSIDTSEITIKNNINFIQNFEKELLVAKESYDDAINNEKVLIKIHDEKIDKIISQVQLQKYIIASQENSLNLVQTIEKEKVGDVWESVKKILSDKSLLLNKLKAELETLKKSKLLLIAKENQNITSIKNEISVAQSNLNKEYVSSGDSKITSPFSGIISKRSLELWEKISPNWEVFRVTGVKNSLSKVTKKEIKFFVPESLKKSIELNKEITFYFGDNASQSFTGSIYRIAPEIDENNFSILVQAKVDENINFPSKSTVRVGFETDTNIFKIPSKTIYNKWERKIIYYKKDNWKLWIRDINIISEDWEYYLVSWKIDEKLKIVTTPIFIK